LSPKLFVWSKEPKLNRKLFKLTLELKYGG